MKLLRNNKAFTIIEMIVVIAVLGILMLLAVPKFLGYTQDAKLTQIKNDIKAYEVAVESGLVDNEKFIDSWNTVPQDEIDTMNSSEKVLNKKGDIVKDLSGTNVFIDRTKVEVKSKLKGDFIWTPTGEVVYYDKNLGNISQGGDNGNNGGDNGTGGNDGEGPTTPETPTEPEKPTYPIEHPNGEKEDEDGTITKPDGTITKPDGTVIDPDGTVIDPDGTITKPDGTITKPDGTITKPDGTVIDPDGTITKPDGTITKPDGTVIKPDGTQHKPNGDIVKPNGDTHKPDGTIIKPDGTIAIYYAKDEDFYTTNHNISCDYEVVRNSQAGYFRYSGPTAETIVLPEVIQGHEMTSYCGMFARHESSKLKKIVSNNKNITSLKYMFWNSGLSTIDISGIDTSSLTDMSYMFSSSKINSVDFSKFDTSKVTHMSGMFSSSKATSLNLINLDTSNVLTMNSMFAVSEAGSISGLTNFNTSNVVDMTFMFNNINATTLDLSSFNTSSIIAIDGMFLNSNKTTTVWLKDTQAVNYFKRLNDKPLGLTFKVK